MFRGIRMAREFSFETKCIYGTKTVQAKADKSGALSMPIYQTASFAHPGVGQSTGYDYTRTKNPTRENVEDVVNALEGGVGGLAFSSGMSAVVCVMSLFGNGDHIIATDDLYGGSVRLFDNVSSASGITVTYHDTSDIKEIEEHIIHNTKAIFLETPSNPTMKVTDIAAVVEVAHKHNILVIVDNTFLTPYYQRPIELGADIVIHSGTKYLGGHNDTLAGFAVCADIEIYNKLKWFQNTCGLSLAPFDSFLITRGIKTLPIRMDRAQENAFKIVDFLKNHPKVKDVLYVGDESHPSYEISKRQASGFGAMISFRVDSKDTAIRLLENIRVANYAESLGGTETLITYPMLQTHGDVPVEIREKLGITDTFLRMSVGIENVADLIADLEQALG